MLQTWRDVLVGYSTIALVPHSASSSRCTGPYLPCACTGGATDARALGLATLQPPYQEKFDLPHIFGQIWVFAIRLATIHLHAITILLPRWKTFVIQTSGNCACTYTGSHRWPKTRAEQSERWHPCSRNGKVNFWTHQRKVLCLGIRELKVWFVRVLTIRKRTARLQSTGTMYSLLVFAS